MRVMRGVATLCVAGLVGAGCSGGSKSNGTTVSGIALPQEVSALPPRATGSTGQALARNQALVAARSQALATDAGTDYSNAATIKYVNEQELSQFNILNTIFKAVGQTHYADAVNVNQGKYGANVSWEEDKGGDSAQKRIVSWIVDSSVVTVGGRTANRLLAWMKMPMGEDGQLHLVTVQLDIYEAPTQAADGTYSDYGVWRLDASRPGASWYFVASADRDGVVPVVMIHQLENGQETRGILKRAAGSGYGQIEAPNYDNCQSQPCPMVHVAYAYDDAHVALQILDGDAVSYLYKDREQVIDVVEKYGLFDGTTGEDVAKVHRFGFPIRYVDANGNQQWGSYGAWMGRHQLWTNGAAIPAGTQVAKADVAADQAKTYTASGAYPGILVARTLVASDLTALTNVPLATWDDGSQSQIWIAYDGSGWVKKQTAGDPKSWPPIFTGSDTPYDFPLRSVYLNSTSGASFVVSQTSPGAYDVKLEVQHVATPLNASDFAGLTFTQPWAGQGASTFAFDPAAFALKYASVGTDVSGESIGSIVTKQLWGLLGSDGLQYNWEYPDQQNQCSNCGVQQFLLDGGAFVLLDDPIRLAPLELTNRGGQTQTYSLQFDGNWINGLPNLYDEHGDFSLDAAAMLSVIMPSAPVTGADGKSYLFKPLRVSEYLQTISDPNDPGIDLANAAALDLGTVPTFVDPKLGDWPTGVAVKYSEGHLVQ